MIYVVIILLLMVCVYLYDYRRMKSYKNGVLNILFCVFTLLAGLRYRIGTDTISYMDFFNTVPNLFDLRLSDFSNTRFAPLAFLSFSLVKTFSSSFFVYQLMISFIVNYSVIRFIKKYGKDGFVFIFLLMYFLTSYYMLNCEVLRESLAICAFLYSIDSLLDKKYIKYFSICFIAVLFHYGAVLLLLFPFCINLRLNKWLVIVVCVFYITSGLFKEYLYLLNYLSFILPLGDLMNVYLQSDLVDEIGAWNIVGTSVYLLLPLMSFLYVKIKGDSSLLKLEPFFVLYLILTCMQTVLYILSRYSKNYMGLFELYYYSAFIYLLCERYRKLFHSFILVVLLLLPRFVFMYKYWTSDFWERAYPDFKRLEVIYPYTNYLTDQTIVDRRESFYRVMDK